MATNDGESQRGKSDGNAYADSITPEVPECDKCGATPWIEQRPAIGIVATCECNQCQVMDFSGRMPGDWE